jgi:uncharacterized protein (DUF2164 family)
MKTAMQELIDYVESNEIVYNKDLILKLKELLEKEKEQIKTAFEQGIEFAFPTNGSYYYNQTYKT